MTSNYVYDHSGRLLMRTDANGNKRKYYYDGINTLLTREKPTGSGTCYRTASAFVLKDAPISQIVTEMRYNYATSNCSQIPTTEYVAYHYDHIGNVTALTECDGLGTLRESFDMEAFGKVHQGNQNGIRLTTKEYDPASELYYFGARWYDKEIGRWMEKEPLGLDRPNLYHFAANNSVRYVDPDGRQMFMPGGPTFDDWNADGLDDDDHPIPSGGGGYDPCYWDCMNKCMDPCFPDNNLVSTGLTFSCLYPAIGIGYGLGVANVLINCNAACKDGSYEF